MAMMLDSSVKVRASKMTGSTVGDNEVLTKSLSATNNKEMISQVSPKNVKKCLEDIHQTEFGHSRER